MKKIIIRLIQLIPRNLVFYKICKIYVDNYNSEMNDDLNSNGEFSFILRNKIHLKRVFDVGGNVGDYTDFLVKNCNSNVDIFEPAKLTFQHLQKRFKGCEHVSIFNNAIGESLVFKNLHVYKGEFSGSNSLYNRQYINDVVLRIESIPQITLDEHCKQHSIAHIDLIKLDIEGNELNALIGAARILTDSIVDVVQFEYGGAFIDGKVLLKDIFEYMQNYEYTAYKLYPKSIRKIVSWTEDLENFQYSNYIFLSNKCISKYK